MINCLLVRLQKCCITAQFSATLTIKLHTKIQTINIAWSTLVELEDGCCVKCGTVRMDAA